MMGRTIDCNHDSLRRLLDGDLPEPSQTAMALHLETCGACRTRLDLMAADENLWSEVRSALSGAEDQELCSGLSGPLDIGPVPLEFLSPSDNPAMLGRIGEFEILELIGCGGMGIVLKGYDHQLNRYVAVKVLHPHCATSAAARRRFSREAQAAAAVVHQHVVAIHAVGANHHPPYLVMPFVPGESLQQRLTREGPMEVIDVLRIGQQVAEGLAAAHAQGLVHRDIKPGNILLERNVDRVLLTDFGLARAADDASLTQSGVIAGTPQYMSPEQARGDSVDHRTDLFSLGTVLYTLLAGHSPFRAETAMAVLRRVCEDTPRPLRELNPHVPDWLEAFIEKLQAKVPDQRFESAEQVADLLKRGLAHWQQPTRVSLPEELKVLIRRSGSRARWKRWVIPSACAVVAIVLAVSLIPLMGKAPRQLPGLSAPAIPPREAFNSEWEDRNGIEPEALAIKKQIERLERESQDQF